MATTIYEYSIKNIGLTNVLNIPIDIANGINIVDTSYVQEVTESCPEGTTAATIRDFGYLAAAVDSKILVENVLDGIRDIITLGGIGSLFGLFTYLKNTIPELSADPNFTSLVFQLNKLESLPTTKTVIPDGITSSMLGSSYADIGSSIRNGIIGNLSVLPLDSSKIALQVISDISNALMNIFTLSYSSQTPEEDLSFILARLTFILMTGFDIEYNETTNNIDVIQGVGQISPNQLSVGFGTNQVKGSISGLEIILQFFQGELVNNLASLSGGHTKIKLITAMCSNDKLRALQNNPNSDIFIGEKNIMQDRENDALRRKNNLDTVISSITAAGLPAEDITNVTEERNQEGANETYYAEKELILEEIAIELEEANY